MDNEVMHSLIQDLREFSRTSVESDLLRTAADVIESLWEGYREHQEFLVNLNAILN